MAGFAGRFEDLPDGEGSTPPLPPEDRLWRHPSEVGATGGPVDEVDVRRRWLTNRPSRASAWTAGLVGALLATGLVALGTHLATAITSGQLSSDNGTEEGPVTTAAVATTATTRVVGTELAAHISSVGQAVAMVNVMVGAEQLECLAVAIDPNGTFLAPARDLIGASGVEITLADGTPYVAQSVHLDRTSGLAILQIHPVSPLSVARLTNASVDPSGSLALAITEPGGGDYALGTLEGSADRPVGGTLLDTLQTDLPVAHTPMGSVILDSSGNVVAMVTGATNTGALATPAFIASSIAPQLMMTGRVSPGWLDIYAENAPPSSTGPGGVRVLSVIPDRAAEKAGLEPGDVITRFDGRPVDSLGQLDGLLYVLRPGMKATVSVERAGRPLLVHVRLDSGPGA